MTARIIKIMLIGITISTIIFASDRIISNDVPFLNKAVALFQ